MRLFGLILFFTFSLFAAENQSKNRIVILSPAVNEIFFELGGGKQVVGNTTYANYPEASRQVTKVGGYFDANFERILALKPTLVLMEKHHERMQKRLEQFGIAYRYVSIATLDDILENIRLAGEILEKTKEAAQLALQVKESTPSNIQYKEACKTLWVFAAEDRLSIPVYAAGHNIYYQDMIEKLGCQNVIPPSQQGQPVLSREMILRLNPTHIILMLPGKENLDEKALIQSWKQLPVTATKEDQIYVLNKEYVFVPSHRIRYLWDDLKAVFQP